MKNLTQRFLAWLERNAQVRREREIESFLSQADDAADLENRMRLLERSLLRRKSSLALQ